MRTSWRVFAAAALIAGLATTPAQAQPNAPIANVTGGKIRGAMIEGQATFKNIPYAAPPVDDLRWREPQPVAAWSGTRDARAFGHPCVQPNAPDTSEDCLTVNVWAPQWPAKSAKAVMVWFHGGGNTEGWANTPFYYGSDLARHGVVVVTAQYRLGVFGFFAHPELTKESAHRASGNYGLLDQIAVLRWVRDNIGAFGGDPANVTIFGESAGAEDVGLLLVSPLAKGLFHRAIAESGPLRKVYPSLARQEKECGGIAAALDAPPMGQIAFLRKLSAEDVLTTAWNNPQACRPVNVDGYVLTEQPLKSYAEGKQHKVPFMLGNTLREGFTPMTTAQLKAEIAAQYGALGPRVLALYGLDRPEPPRPDPLYGDALIQYGTDQSHRCRAVLEGIQHAATGEAFYQFQFSRSLPGQTEMMSTHTDEIPFVFGETALKPMRLMASADAKLSEQMESYWTNFAKQGDPNGPGLPRWTKFDAGRKAYMSFAESGAAPGEGLRRAQCDIFLDAERARPTWQYPERAPE